MNFKFYTRFVVYLFVVLAVSSARAGAYEDFFQAIERDDGGKITALLQRGFDPNTRDPHGHVPLYMALRTGSASALQALWAHPALDVNATNVASETPLMMAALRGNLEWTRKLLARGAPLHRDGWSPVHYAATAPEPDVLKFLLERGAPVDARSPNGSTPLMMAARYGHSVSIELLLARGADPKLRNDRGANAADFARMDGRDAVARRLDPLMR